MGMSGVIYPLHLIFTEGERFSRVPPYSSYTHNIAYEWWKNSNISPLNVIYV